MVLFKPDLIELKKVIFYVPDLKQLNSMNPRRHKRIQFIKETSIKIFLLKSGSLKLVECSWSVSLYH